MAYPSNLPDDPSELENFETKPEEVTLANIVMYGERHIEISKELETYDEMVKQLESEQKDIEEVKLPDIFNKLRIGNFTLADKTKMEAEDKFQGSIVLKNPEKRDEQLEWLTGHDGKDIIKEEIVCSFPKGRESEAIECKRLLAEFGFEFTVKQSVHAGTLGKFIKEKIARAEEVPLEKLGWRFFKKVTIKSPGSKTKSRKKSDDYE